MKCKKHSFAVGDVRCGACGMHIVNAYEIEVERNARLREFVKEAVKSNMIRPSRSWAPKRLEPEDLEE